MRNGAVKQLRASPREKRGAERSGAAPGARPGLEPAGSSSAGAATLGCSLGLGPICLLLPGRGLLATVLTAGLGRHRLSTRCLQRVHPHLLPLSGSPRAPCARPWRCACSARRATALQAPSLEPPGPKWSGGTPHPLASWPHRSSDASMGWRLL